MSSAYHDQIEVQVTVAFCKTTIIVTGHIRHLVKAGLDWLQMQTSLPLAGLGLKPKTNVLLETIIL